MYFICIFPEPAADSISMLHIGFWEGQALSRETSDAGRPKPIMHYRPVLTGRTHV